VRTVNKFVRSIPATYSAPEKEKAKIVSDMRELVSRLSKNINVESALWVETGLPEAIRKLYDNQYTSEINQIRRLFIEDAEIDKFKPSDDLLKSESVYFKERFGKVKKLKKIPRDLIAYITIEGESIRDAGDKMMIVSYAYGKLEIIEWYIELLITGTERYIVPHSKDYLESLRTQILACIKKIMDKPLPKLDRPLIQVGYPKGYEG
jgi:hypothetical protein